MNKAVALTIHYADSEKIFIDINNKPAPQVLYDEIFDAMNRPINVDGPSLLDLLKELAE